MKRWSRSRSSGTEYQLPATWSGEDSPAVELSTAMEVTVRALIRQCWKQRNLVPATSKTLRGDEEHVRERWSDIKNGGA